MNDLFFNNGVGEFDFTSIGQKFHVSRKINMSQMVDFGEYEKNEFIRHKTQDVAAEIAREIADKSVVEVRRNNDGVEITTDFILISPKEYYEMLNIVEKHFGSTMVRYQK